MSICNRSRARLVRFFLHLFDFKDFPKFESGHPEIRPRLLLIANRKSRKRFWLLPKPTTLDDLEWPYRTVLHKLSYKLAIEITATEGKEWGGKSLRNSLSKNLTLCGSTCAPITFLLVDQTLPNFFSSNVGEIVVDSAVFRLSMSSFFPEIFAIEVWSCAKSHQIFDGFALPNSKGGGQSPKIVPTSSCRPRGTLPGKVWWGWCA